MYQSLWQYSDGDPLTGALNAGGGRQNRYFRPSSRFIECCQRCDRQLLETRVGDNHRW